MAPYVLLVTLSVDMAQLDAYRVWHDAHLQELVTHVDGIERADRYEPVDRGPFVAVYTLIGDPDTTLADLERARGEGCISAPPEGVILDAERTLLHLGGRAAG